MPRRIEAIAMPASREPLSLLAVDRAVSELRRGRIVVIYGGGGAAILAQAAEAVTPEGLNELSAIARVKPVLAITARRAAVLKPADHQAKVVCLGADNGLTAEIIYDLADPLSGFPRAEPDNRLEALKLTIEDAPPHDCRSAAVSLAKLARLLPAAITAKINDPDADDLARWTARHDLLMVDAGDIFQYEHTAARTLRAISEARVPLSDAEDTRIIAFRPIDGGLEHLAIIIGNPAKDKDSALNKPILTRIHSECFTGDLLGSLRCDCGDQLRGAIKEIAKTGGGVLLYLAQEGRGIGLVNKLRAYELQDRGHDTMEANEQLGFYDDERIYLPAAQMLRSLGFTNIRLMTNNPDKVAALSRCGINIAERVPHAFPSNAHNEGYLRAKARRGGHLF
ncbi:MAG: GTP cyclohydrolase II [Rhodospirillales bacterium RIFCSPLOWO2_12_FULL_58_28]|nr:MAG: GTP cyclohydrolase II [Rhodospirillales bacterium RIFCSPLOWO2_02_FULL_58_16]OHC77395.1 MAG: GTP cyclohydrolase II [Rhodospirillales bacterium RIFCSPLOWO2_12_FULL_58_28]